MVKHRVILKFISIIRRLMQGCQSVARRNTSNIVCCSLALVLYAVCKYNTRMFYHTDEYCLRSVLHIQNHLHGSSTLCFESALCVYLSYVRVDAFAMLLCKFIYSSVVASSLTCVVDFLQQYLFQILF
jgi:hypothetical protein